MLSTCHNPVYGYDFYDIANNQFLMGDKSPAKMNVETTPEGNHINYIDANQNKEILWRSGVVGQQVVIYLHDGYNQKTQRVNMILYNIKNSNKRSSCEVKNTNYTITASIQCFATFFTCSAILFIILGSRTEVDSSDDKIF